MIYVQQSLLPDEKIIFGGTFHWMYSVSAFMWIAFCSLISIIIIVAAINFEFTGLPAQHYFKAVTQINPLFRVLAFGVFVFGVIKCGMMFAIRATTEIAITNRRLIYKRGIVARFVDEMSVDRIEGIIVQQSILGRILGYGRVVIRGMGVGAVVLPPMIERPVDLRRAVEHARDV